MAIVNPTMLQPYDSIEPQLLKAVEDVVLNSDDEATERLIALAEKMKNEAGQATGQHSTQEATALQAAWRKRSVEERLAAALASGDSQHLADDIPEAIEKYGKPIAVIEGPLMRAMEDVGARFAEGKMFLPQIVKAAQVMKEAVALLQPFIDADSEGCATGRPKVVLATVNGDVHDIGKNIVAIVLACNGFDVVDLGVMVAADAIVEATHEHRPLLVGVSGLITPSLKEMETLCQLFQREGLRVPIIVGGATTSAVHTAVRLAPLYDGLVVHGGDASQTALIAKRLQMDANVAATQLRADQERIRESYEASHAPIIPYDKANMQAPHFELPSCYPSAAQLQASISGIDVPLSAVEPYIDWRMFLLFWGFKGETLQQQLVNPEAGRTLYEGKETLRKAIDEQNITLQALISFEPAVRQGNDIVLHSGVRLPMLRSQNSGGNFRCLADFLDEHTHSPIGLFTIAAKPVSEADDEHLRLMTHALCARLAEACAEWLKKQTKQANICKPSESSNLNILRVAFGYATCPDHSLKRIVVDCLQAEQLMGISLTDHYAITPSTSICGLFICHPEAHYFPVGRIDKAQLSDYCKRRGIREEEGQMLLSKYIVED